MDDSEQQDGDESAGAPAWVMTFADLMSLLMCFFVLLLSFSEMDVAKYKEVAGSVKFAFGVQREIKVKEIVKGTSIIAKHYSPGKPTPTPFQVLKQQTTDESKENIDFSDSALKNAEEQAQALKEKLEKEIEAGLVEIETMQNEVLIRIREHGSFPSGSAQLQESFYPVLDKIGGVLNETGGRLIVSGHSDNVPISTSRYPSNWVLSATRASSVVHHLTKGKLVAPNRMEMRAHADTLPIAPNTTPENRAKNRRVEIIVAHGENAPDEPEEAEAGAENTVEVDQ